MKQLKELLVADHEIGIISPYNGQVKRLRKVLAPITKAEVLNTFDFQAIFSINDREEKRM